MTVHWLNVKASGAVERVGYDPAGRALHIVYAGGREYAYEGVPAQEVKALLDAESIGQYVNWRIKPRYRFQELGAAQRTSFARRTLASAARGPADRWSHRKR